VICRADHETKRAAPACVMCTEQPAPPLMRPRRGRSRRETGPGRRRLGGLVRAIRP
jgi:hypothetical protein